MCQGGGGWGMGRRQWQSVGVGEGARGPWEQGGELMGVGGGGEADRSGSSPRAGRGPGQF